jgi:toxin co-regulated pilus biosynthesis protein T
MLGKKQMSDAKKGKKLTIKSRSKEKPAEADGRSGGLALVANVPDAQPSKVLKSSVRDIRDSSQLPIPEIVLSGDGAPAVLAEQYVLGELVSDKALVFKSNNGSVWLLHSNDLNSEQRIELVTTKTEIKKRELNYVFASCPKDLFIEFSTAAREQSKSRQTFEASDQHLHFEKLVLDAVKLNVSDIHITVSRGRVIVEYRIDSRNQPINHFSWSVSVEQTTSLVRSVFNTIAGGTQRSWNPRIPQDAQITHSIEGKSYQLRYAHDNIEGDGFHVVLRVLDDLSDDSEGDEGSYVPLQKLGLYDDEVEVVDQMLEAPFGFMCVSGTTGSGKSTFLKNTIGAYGDQRPGKNILTVENPVEYRIPNAKQTSVSDSAHMSEHLVSMLRRDPDAVLIGEIRDRESAGVSVQATQTGHFVWATLHASNALAQISRLEDIGISRATLAAPEFIAGMVHLALARKVCTSCRIPIEEGYKLGFVPEKRFERVQNVSGDNLNGVFIANPRGCSACTESAAEGKENVNSGFRGRMAVPEMVIPNIRILKAIKDGDDLGAYEAWREIGGKTLQEAAVRRMLDGHLCANEVEIQFKRLNHDAEFYA